MATRLTIKQQRMEMLQRGYDVRIARGAVAKKFVCHLCSGLLRNPVQTGCGERFCRPCSDSLLKKPYPTCPLCNDTLSQKLIFRDAFAEREVNALLVACGHKEAGCTWEGLLRLWDEHVDGCEHASTECPGNGCHAVLPRKQMTLHVSAECSYREMQCEWCGSTVQFLHLGDHHQKECARLPVSCAQCGQSDIARCQMTEHVRLECPRSLITCPLFEYGCQEQYHRSDENQHNMDHAPNHVLHLTGVIQKLMVDMTSLTTRVVVAEGKLSEYEKSSQQCTQHTPFRSPDNLTLSQKLDELQMRSEEHTRRISATEAACKRTTSSLTEMKQSQDSNKRNIAVQDDQLADLSLRLDIANVKTTNGVLVWKIDDVMRRRHEARAGKTPSLYSAPFYTSPCGHKMCARIYMDGDGVGKGTSLSIFLVLMRGEFDALLSWPFQHRVSIVILDQSDSSLKRHITEVFRPASGSASFKRPTTEMNTGSGFPTFAPVSILDSPTYVKDDVIFIKFVVDT